MKRLQNYRNSGKSFSSEICLLLVSIIFFGSYCVASAAQQVREFVQKQYRHGVPYAGAAQFSTNEVPELIAMLHDQAESNWWGNIVVTLGIIRDDRAVEPLINFLERDIKGEVGHEVFKALLSVHYALGHIASNGSQKAVDYLISNASPETWAAKKLPWKIDGQPGEVFAKSSLINSAIMGLGFSISPKALEWLSKENSNSTLSEQYKSSVKESLRRANEIMLSGRGNVFGCGYKPLDTNQIRTQLSTVQSVAITNREEVIQQALAAYEQITSDAVNGRLYEFARCLADNGRPVLPPEDQNVAAIDRVVQKLRGRWAVGFEKTKQIIAEVARLHGATNSYGPADVKVADDGTVIVQIFCVNSKEAAGKFLPVGSPGETVSREGELVIYMLCRGGRWYWNPFGW